jgi:hypothetical protein
MLAVFLRHWKEIGAVPLADALNVAGWPAETVTLTGSAVSDGAMVPPPVFERPEQPAREIAIRTAVNWRVRIVRRTSYTPHSIQAAGLGEAATSGEGKPSARLAGARITRLCHKGYSPRSKIAPDLTDSCWPAGNTDPQLKFEPRGLPLVTVHSILVFLWNSKIALH